MPDIPTKSLDRLFTTFYHFLYVYVRCATLLLSRVSLTDIHVKFLDYRIFSEISCVPSVSLFSRFPVFPFSRFPVFPFSRFPTENFSTILLRIRFHCQPFYHPVSHAPHRQSSYSLASDTVLFIKMTTKRRDRNGDVS